MATPGQVSFFDSARVTGIMRGLNDPRLLPVPLIWNQRIPDVPATDEEVTAKYVGTLLIADLIADDARAVTYSQGRFQFESYQVPNIKMGMAMNQAMINAFQRIQEMGGIPNDDVGFFSDRYARMVADVKYGVELRKEALKIAMLLDGTFPSDVAGTTSFSRLGIKMSSVSWGMYSDLKVTPTTAWSSTSATGLTDIQTVRQVARARYGIELDRITMSTAALRALVAQTEFQNQVKNVQAMVLLGAPAPVAPLQSDAYLIRLAELIIGGAGGSPFTIEIDDRRFWSQDNTAAIVSNRFHPISSVLLTARANDGNTSAYDFANCVVTESIVASVMPGSLTGRLAVGRGPIGYWTGNPDLNPPNLTCWGVARGFPRKHMNQASAVLSVGTLTETFSASPPAVL